MIYSDPLIYLSKTNSYVTVTTIFLEYMGMRLHMIERSESETH